MSDLRLSMIVSDNPRTRPLIDRRVTVDGVDLLASTGRPGERRMVERQLLFEEFDVSEMPLSWFQIAVSQGDQRFVGVPVFSARGVYHAGMVVRTNAGIETPEDLKGKRIGVPEYAQTSAVWARAALQHEYGVLPQDVEWCVEQHNEEGGAGWPGCRLPGDVKYQVAPAGKRVRALLESGDVDASLLAIPGGAGGASTRPLFADAAGEASRYRQSSGLFPVNHFLVMRRTVFEANPWVAPNLFFAFNKAKALGQGSLRELTAAQRELGMIPDDVRKALDTDLFPYGVEPNRTALEVLADYAHEQGLTPRPVGLEEMFAPNTLDL